MVNIYSWLRHRGALLNSLQYLHQGECNSAFNMKIGLLLCSFPRKRHFQIFTVSHQSLGATYLGFVIQKIKSMYT